METMIVECEQALALVRELLAQLEPGERVEITRYDSALALRREKSLDPERLHARRAA